MNVFIVLLVFVVLGTSAYSTTLGTFITSNHNTYSTQYSNIAVCDNTFSYLSGGNAVKCLTANPCYLYVMVNGTTLSVGITNSGCTGNMTCGSTDGKINGMNLTFDVLAQLANGIYNDNGGQFGGAVAALCSVLNGALK